MKIGIKIKNIQFLILAFILIILQMLKQPSQQYSWAYKLGNEIFDPLEPDQRKRFTEYEQWSLINYRGVREEIIVPRILSLDSKFSLDILSKYWWLAERYTPISINDFIAPIDFTKEHYWFFSRGLWINLSNNNTLKLASFSFQVNLYQVFFIAIAAVMFIWSVVALAYSKTIQIAISSFFVYLIAVTVFLFFSSSDYLGTLVLIVYSGAVLIFFAFVLFTVDPKWFLSSNDLYTGVNAQINKKSFFNENKNFFAFISIINSIGILLFFVNGDFSCHKASLIQNCDWTLTATVWSKKTHIIFILGEQLFSDYWVATTLLAFLLLIVLIISMYVLQTMTNITISVKPSFFKTFFSFRTYTKK